MKKFLRILAIVAAVLAAACVFVGIYMCNYALLPEEHGNEIEADRAKIDQKYPGLIAWYDDLHENGYFRDTTIIGENGYKLHAVYSAAAQPETANGTAVVVHGYTDNHLCFLNLVRMYRDELNYNVMVPDLHYHGYSEGRAIQMGWLDRLDVKRWTELAHEIWDDDFMLVHGVSMGAATTMMLSGEELPDYIKAFVEDCGYSSVWNQFAHNLKDIFNLPPFPVLHSASLICRIKYGWGFKEASAVKQLAKCERPMLFIHGSNDDFVPTDDIYDNYEAKVKGYKEMWIAPGSEHAESYRDYPEEYTAHVRDFLARVKAM